MKGMKRYGLEEIRQCLAGGRFPVSGITELGSAEFHFREPARYLGVTLHSGSRVRPEMMDPMEVSRKDRMREEDPYMDRFIQDFPLHLIACDSRFEYDLNWEIDKTIYSFDRKKWGLQIWNRPLTPSEMEVTYSKYKEFHALLDIIIGYILEKSMVAILFDIHSFCYQREERVAWWGDPKPEINLGTRFVNRKFFAPLINLFLEGVSGTILDGHTLRVAENAIFPGGYLTRKYTDSHNRRVLVLAIEYKKIFMNEWTGELYDDIVNVLKDNLLLTTERVVQTKF